MNIAACSQYFTEVFILGSLILKRPTLQNLAEIESDLMKYSSYIDFLSHHLHKSDKTVSDLYMKHLFDCLHSFEYSLYSLRLLYSDLDLGYLEIHQGP